MLRVFLVLLFLQLIQLPLNEISVELRIFIRSIESQCIFISLDGLLPDFDRLFRLLLKSALTDPVEGITKVIVGLCLDPQIRCGQRLLQQLHRFLELTYGIRLGSVIVVSHHVSADFGDDHDTGQHDRSHRLDASSSRSQLLLLALPLPLTDYRLHSQHQQCCSQWPLITFEWNFFQLLGKLTLWRHRQSFLINRLQPFSSPTQWDIESACRYRDLLQRRHVQFRPHHLTAFVL